VWGIILQFPFYGGIFGIMKSSGLAEVIATPQTYPLIVYWCLGILNYFVPSGGSKWIIEAPYIVRAACQLGVGMSETVLAYVWGGHDDGCHPAVLGHPPLEHYLI